MSWESRPKFVRAYCVAETADGTKYEFECVEPAFVSIDMSVPRDWAICDVPLDAIMFQPKMSCFEMSFRAQHNKQINATISGPEGPQHGSSVR